jgi:hypothetical protein
MAVAGRAGMQKLVLVREGVGKLGVRGERRRQALRTVRGRACPAFPRTVRFYQTRLCRVHHGLNCKRFFSKGN